MVEGIGKRPDMSIQGGMNPGNIGGATGEKAAGMKIASFAELKAALLSRLDFFAAHGCSLSDHALNYVMYAPASEEEVERVFTARLQGTMPSVPSLR